MPVFFLAYKLISLFPNNKKESKEFNATTSQPVQNVSQKVVFNNMSTSANLEELAVTLTLADTLFEAEKEIYCSDLKKINHVIKELSPSLRLWVAKQLLSNPKLKANYFLFCDHLLNYDDSAQDLNELRTEFFNTKQNGRKIEEFISEMEVLASKLRSSNEDALFLIQQGLDFEFQKFLIHHRIPDDFEQAKSDLIYFYNKFKISSPVLNNVGSSKKGPLSHEEKLRRRLNNLCLYCGGSNHKVSDCPLIAKKNSYLEIQDNKNLSSYFSILVNFDVNGQIRSVPALLDSGADHCYMSMNLAKELKLDLTKTIPGTLADGTSFALYNTPKLSFYTDSLTHNTIFKVSNNLVHPVVLGLHFFQQNQLQFDYVSNNCILQGVTIPILNSLTQTSIFNTSASEDLPECLKEFKKVFLKNSLLVCLLKIFGHENRISYYKRTTSWQNHSSFLSLITST